MEIFIDIKKKLPGFQLNVKLTSEKDIIGILGASGSGKSMLLRCISGLVNPDEGKIIINGKTFFDSQSKINMLPRERKVGFLFQNYALFPHLTIWENISFGLDGLSKSDKDGKVTELMERFHLKNMENRYPSQISGGQQQRVALARAIAIEPEILLLDEPFSALDDHLRNHMIKEMSESLKAFQGNTLFVTHNMEEAYHLCDRIAVLNAGSVEAFDLKQKLFQSPVSLETAKITGCKNISEAVKKSEYSIEIPAWGIQVNTGMKIEAEHGFAGIRANNIKLADNSTMENCFAGWIADKSETPFRTTLYLKIGSAPENSDDFHIEWEISQEQMNEITNLSQPIYIMLEPKHLFFVYK
jgi:ABC-type sulfate/molybdate transport systems ATPase subunit